MIRSQAPRRPSEGFRSEGHCVPLALHQFSAAMASDLEQVREGYGTTHSEVVPVLRNHGWTVLLPESGRYPTLQSLLVEQPDFTGLVTGMVSCRGRSVHHMAAIRAGIMLDETQLAWDEQPLSMIWLPPAG